jgi:DNA topoisomerase IB
VTAAGTRRLRRVDPSSPGIIRRGRGRGFEYLDPGGERIEDGETVERIAALAIPPAWREVWICPDPRGHIQATGLDARGRKQYLYHQAWRERRDREKFDEMLDFARALPRLRARVAADLAEGRELSRDRILACTVRLLDRGFFRVGGEEYAAENDSFGLATMRKEHVAVDGSSVTFSYPAKSGRHLLRELKDPEVAEIVLKLKRRRGGGEELLAYKRGRRWLDLRSEDINEYVKDAAGGGYSAKDFRTWNATVLAATTLAVAGAMVNASETARKRVKNHAVKEVARYLGNTPAVARASYIDPRVFERFDEGLTIGGALAALVGDDDIGAPAVQSPLEEAVLDLILETESEALERVA